jgi:cobalt-precorrin 5A hydrolase
MDNQSFAHSKWNCKYHIVFAPKYRRQIIYGKIKSDIGVILRKLCEYKGVEALLVDGSCVGLSSDFKISGQLPTNIVLENKCPVGIVISLSEQIKLFETTLNLIPKVIWIGIGCKKDTTAEAIEQLVFQLLNKFNISIYAVAGLTSIDIKKDEQGLLEFTSKYLLNINFYSANELNSVIGEFGSSDFVKSITGVDNVCERAAVIGSENGHLLCKKTAKDGVTVALACAPWRVCFED